MSGPIGWTCAVCGASVDLVDPAPWRCPNATRADRHHVLVARLPPATGGRPRGDEPSHDTNPFIAYDHRLTWAAAAEARGMTGDDRAALVVELDRAIQVVDGIGFHRTPFTRSTVLSDEFGFDSSGGVWVKDETTGVAGSQKARHLFSILLHLRALEITGEIRERAPLAIASCGNAALAAATLARAADWPLEVFVPTWMGDGFGRRLDELGAHVHRCERRDTDPPGDPAMLRFRDAVDDGAIPFTVQGTENALCLDGGRTLGWEISDQVAAPGGPGSLDALMIQVGGGAFATCVGAGSRWSEPVPPIVAVQAAGCAPFDRARRRADGVDDPAAHWSELMTPWDEPHSLADGILDDETYDWLGVLGAVEQSAGSSVVASESSIERAHSLALDAGFDASPTGSAGLAGLVELDGAFAGTSRVAVIMSGITR